MTKSLLMGGARAKPHRVQPSLEPDIAAPGRPCSGLSRGVCARCPYCHPRKVGHANITWGARRCSAPWSGNQLGESAGRTAPSPPQGRQPQPSSASKAVEAPTASVPGPRCIQDSPRAGVVAHRVGDPCDRRAVEHVREAREPDGLEPFADVGGHADRAARRHRAPPREGCPVEGGAGDLRSTLPVALGCPDPAVVRDAGDGSRGPDGPDGRALLAPLRGAEGRRHGAGRRPATPRQAWPRGSRSPARP